MAFDFTPSSIVSDAVLGLNLLTGSLNSDSVGVFDQQTLKQVFAGARPMKADVRETARLMKRPAETGVTISDHKILNPNMIELSLIIPAEFYNSTYQQIRSAWINSTLLSVQTRSGVYRNMVIEEMPHLEDPELYDVITMGLRFTEIQYVVPNSIAPQNAPANYAPLDPVNGNTILRGQQSSLIPIATSLASYIHVATVWGL